MISLWMVAFFASMLLLGMMLEERVFGISLLSPERTTRKMSIFEWVWASISGVAVWFLIPNVGLGETIASVVIGIFLAGIIAAVIVVVRLIRGEVELDDRSGP